MLLAYNRKSVGPKMESRGTLVFTGYSCKDFQSRIHLEDFPSRNQKKGHISLGDQHACYLQVFQRLC